MSPQHHVQLERRRWWWFGGPDTIIAQVCPELDALFTQYGNDTEEKEERQLFQKERNNTLDALRKSFLLLLDNNMRTTVDGGVKDKVLLVGRVVVKTKPTIRVFRAR